MSGYSDYIVPLIILAVTVAGIIKKTDIFNAFVEGAAEGLKTTSAILPSLICLMTCIGMFRASGAMELLVQLVSPITSFSASRTNVRRLYLYVRFPGAVRYLFMTA